MCIRDRFYRISSRVGLDLFKECNHLDLVEEIEMKVGGNFTAAPGPRGTIILKIESRRQLESLQELKTLCEIDVQFEEHSSLNTVKGTIYSGEYKNEPKDKIQMHLSKYGVTDVYITTKLVFGQQIPTGVIILTFDSKVLPQEIKLGFCKYRVREYLPLSLIHI